MQIDFHDTSRGTRVPSMNDHFGFTMASLNEKGSVFANPCKGDKHMSTLMYRPFGSWANNSEVRYLLLHKYFAESVYCNETGYACFVYKWLSLIVQYNTVVYAIRRGRS